MSGNWSMARLSSCLIVITFLTGLGMTIHEHRELLAYAEHAASHNLDFHPAVDIYRQNVVFALILSGGVIAHWSANSAKIALVLMWFLDSRRAAQIGVLGTAFTYPPVTINATFQEAGVEHIILLILCALSLLFTLIVASRENKHEGRKQQS